MPEGAPVFALNARQSKHITLSVRDGCAERLREFSDRKRKETERNDALSEQYDRLDQEERAAWGDPSRGEPKNPAKWEKARDAFDKCGRQRLAQHDVLDKIEKEVNAYLDWKIEQRVLWAKARAEGRL